MSVTNPSVIAPIQALHSLRDQHLVTVEQTMSLLGTGWSAERLDSCDGHAMILLTAPEHQTDGCFILHGDADGVRLGLMLDDCWTPLGSFPTMIAALHQAARMGSQPAPQVIAPTPSAAA